MGVRRLLYLRFTLCHRMRCRLSLRSTAGNQDNELMQNIYIPPKTHGNRNRRFRIFRTEARSVHLYDWARLAGLLVRFLCTSQGALFDIVARTRALGPEGTMENPVMILKWIIIEVM